MTSDWDFRPLGTVCEVLDHLRRPVTKKDRLPGPYPYYGATGIVDYVSDFLFDEPLVLVGEDGAKWESGDATAFAIAGPSWVNNHAHVLRPDRVSVLDEWIVHYLVHKDLSQYVAGLTVPKLNQGSLREIPIPLPALSEQRRIVTILDEAFEGIATAKAHAEKNLQRAREALDCHLTEIFANRRDGWSSKPFEECIEEVKYTNKIQRKEFLAAGAFPVISQESEFINGYWNNGSDLFRISRPLVVFGDHTQVLKYIDFDFVLGADGVKVLIPQIFLNPRFFYYALRAAPVRSLGYSRHYRLLKELQIGFPSVAEQVSIAVRLDAVVEEVQRLGRIYAAKIDSLASLRQSLLHQAFSGAL